MTACSSNHMFFQKHISWWHPLDRYRTQHVVSKGDTLYAIAFRYDQDYRQLAINNLIEPPYKLRVGQVIRLKSNSKKKKSFYTISGTSAIKVRGKPVSLASWTWPLKGVVQARFIPSKGQKGIDISGHKLQKIYAASSGIVAYSGMGLPGYGNLIIINHPNHYLTAYGNNSKNLVQEGQSVIEGQTIGVIGVVDNRYWGLHFEVRKSGIPVNPLSFLSR